MEKVIRVKLTVLTPVHIGAGQKLRRGVDFVCRNSQVHVLSPEKILQAIGEAQYKAWLSSIEEDRQEEFLQALDPTFQRFAQRTLNGRFSQSGVLPTDFHLHITSPTRGAYIPGSSLKGAVLTLFVRQRILKNEIVITPEMLLTRNREGKRFFNDKKLMQKIWGPDPNTSLGRFIRFSDFHAAEPNGSATEVQWVRILNKTQRGWAFKDTSLLAECLPAGWQAQGTLTLLPEWLRKNNDYITRENYKRKEEDKLKPIPPGDFLHSLDVLKSLIRDQTEEEIKNEMDDLKNEDLNNHPVGVVYLKKLESIQKELQEGKVILRVGGHVGWNFTTGGWAKFLDEKQLPDKEFRLLRETIQEKDYSNMDLWPKTRKMTDKGVPLGFVLLELKEQS